MRIIIFSNAYGRSLFKLIVAFVITLAVIVALGNIYLYYLTGLNTFNVKDLYQSAWQLTIPAFIVAMTFAVRKKG